MDQRTHTIIQEQDSKERKGMCKLRHAYKALTHLQGSWVETAGLASPFPSRTNQTACAYGWNTGTAREENIVYVAD